MSRRPLRSVLRRVRFEAFFPLALYVATTASKVNTTTMSKTLNPYREREPFVGTTVVKIAVPSGKLIAADDLRTTPHFDVDPIASINYGAGCDEWTRRYAELAQVAHAFVGNSSPLISRQADGSLVVVTPDFDEVIGELLSSDEKVVAHICTDLWSTMLTDYEHWLSHGGPAIEAANEPYAIDNKFSMIDVTPGLYRWTVYSNDDSFDRDRSGRIEYAKLELIQAY